MAGTDSRFDASAFRDAVHFAMNMGLPQTESERATFHFRGVKTWPPGTVLDQDGTPINPNISPTTVTPDPVQIPCAVEFSQAKPDELPAGQFIPTKATVTILDEDYPQVKDAIEVELNGDRYAIRYTPPSMGLFEVTVYQFICFAKDES